MFFFHALLQVHGLASLGQWHGIKMKIESHATAVLNWNNVYRFDLADMNPMRLSLPTYLPDILGATTMSALDDMHLAKFYIHSLVSDGNPLETISCLLVRTAASHLSVPMLSAQEDWDSWRNQELFTIHRMTFLREEIVPMFLIETFPKVLGVNCSLSVSTSV